MLIVLTLYLAFLKSAGIALLEVFLLQRENHSCFTFFIDVLRSDVKAVSFKYKTRHQAVADDRPHFWIQRKINEISI